MKKLLILVFITLISLSFITEAQAKRFGGGRSFGATRSTSTLFSARTNRASFQQPFSQAKRWLAPIMGFALGGMLAALFMGHGLGQGILTWVILIAGIYLITQLIRKRNQPLTAPFQANHAPFEQYHHSQSPFMRQTNTSMDRFDEPAFLRQAKGTFLRLQAAYDSKNLSDIMQFTLPQIFAEVKLQLDERGNSQNVTEVVNLNAEIASYEPTFISVRFNGLIKEEINEPAQAFTEIWHFQQDEHSGQWKVAGIQQEINNHH